MKRRPSPNGKGNLFPVALRKGMARHAVGGRPLSLRQMVRPEQPIEERKVNRKVDVDGLLFDAVMPMMEAWDDEELFQEAKAPTQIRVDERRVDIDDEHVGLDEIGRASCRERV